MMLNYEEVANYLNQYLISIIMNRNNLLYFNTPLKLAIASYLLDSNFIASKFENDDFKKAISGREYGFGFISRPELERLIQIYNPSFKINAHAFSGILEKMVETGIVEKNKGSELNKKFNNTGKFNEKVNYYSISDVHLQTQLLFRYILETSIENGLDYASTIHTYPSINNNNGIRWDMISVLENKPLSIKQICDLVEGLEFDNFYNNSDHLLHANLINTSKQSKKDKTKKYVKTHKFNVDELSESDQKRAFILENNYLIGESFNDSELYRLFVKEGLTINSKTVNSFRNRLQKKKMLKLDNPEILEDFSLTQLGYRMLYLIIQPVDHFLKTRELPKHYVYNYNERILKTALSYRK